MNIDDFIKTIKFDEKGLVPVIAQDHLTNEVLMLAYASEEALRKTLSTGKAHYFSRSRQKLWLKGEESGHVQYVKQLFYDCDSDTLLLKVEQIGVACHTGHRTCFFTEFKNNRIFEKKDTIPDGAVILDAVFSTILQRKNNPPPKSYVHSLMVKGVDEINAKIIEEAGEVAEAATMKQNTEIVYESADLIFHLLVLLGYKDISPREVYRELKRRFGVSGIDEKASRKKQG